MAQCDLRKLDAKIAEMKAQLLERIAEHNTEWYRLRSASLKNLEAMLSEILNTPNVEFIR